MYTKVRLYSATPFSDGQEFHSCREEQMPHHASNRAPERFLVNEPLLMLTVLRHGGEGGIQASVVEWEVRGWRALLCLLFSTSIFDFS
jgi:hypothetical protein